MGYDEYDGWGPAAEDYYVCAGCVHDDDLAERLRAAAEERQCDYCDAPRAAPLQVLADAVYEGLCTEYTDPANELPYESAEGGYQGATYDGYDLVMYETESWTDDDDLREDVARAMIDFAFCDRDYFLMRRSEALAGGWTAFVEQVKHHTRYLFLRERGDPGWQHPDDIPPAEMLNELGKEVDKVGMVRFLPAGTELFRVRVHPIGEAYDDAPNLGAPPREFARGANRMSPAGIPMFYAALDPDTALAETVDPTRTVGMVATLGTWVCGEDVSVLDLTSVGPVPSLYSEERRHLREATRFLRSFTDEVSAPIGLGLEQIDYVPTQVVTEYFRVAFETEDGTRPLGMLYRSSRTPGGTACVLFFGPEGCGEWDGAGAVPTTHPVVLRRADVRRVDLTTSCKSG